MGERWTERVAGTYHANAHRQPRVGEWLEVTREPHNIHDRNAISLRVDGEHIGYVNRITAETLAPSIDAGHDLFAQVVELAFGGRIYVEYSGPAADRAEAVERALRRREAAS